MNNEQRIAELEAKVKELETKLAELAEEMKTYQKKSIQSPWDIAATRQPKKESGGLW